MSAGRGSRGQLNSEKPVAVEQSTWTERSPSTGRLLSSQNTSVDDLTLPDQYIDTIQSSVVYSRLAAEFTIACIYVILYGC